VALRQAFKLLTNLNKPSPQRLKPHLFSMACGTAEAVPFQSQEFFQQAVKPCPFKNPDFSAIKSPCDDAGAFCSLFLL
jgi:hypothetical protein